MHGNLAINLGPFPALVPCFIFYDKSRQIELHVFLVFVLISTMSYIQREQKFNTQRKLLLSQAGGGEMTFYGPIPEKTQRLNFQTKLEKDQSVGHPLITSLISVDFSCLFTGVRIQE